MPLPVFIVPPGGVKVVALPKLPGHLFAPYESAWAWAAKLAAANALSACEVSGLLGIAAPQSDPLLPEQTPRVAQALGRGLGFPAGRIRDAFLDGPVQCLKPLMHERLRLCPECARHGHHFIIHQLRPFACCPLHGLPLRDHCRRCGAPQAYALGNSMVFGPVSCATCRAPQLPLSVGGQPVAGVMAARSVELIARWLAFLRRRVTLPAWSDMDGVLGARQFEGSVRRQRMQAIIPPGPAPYRLVSRWPASLQHACLERCYWRQANVLWRQCDDHGRQWYRGVVRGLRIDAAPGAQALAFAYWRMTWQGCSNPYLLRRAHGLPLYGIAEWEASQCAHDDDDIDVTMSAFEDALAASWADWLDCIDLLGAKELERETWRLRAPPSTFVLFPKSKKRRGTKFFAQLLRSTA
ncbi:MAG: hypothetical protein K2X55_15130 [Burkholderiaceae bacterium]|nr:hypothetical protein [Burkholderiaceae bacterium]